MFYYFYCVFNEAVFISSSFPRGDIRELKQTATEAATGTLLNKRFNEQNNSCARAL